MNVGRMALGNMEGARSAAFLSSFGVFDLLWFGLAAATAFKLGASAADSRLPGPPYIRQASPLTGRRYDCSPDPLPTSSPTSHLRIHVALPRGHPSIFFDRRSPDTLFRRIISYLGLRPP
jgi:hypothetical protein